MLGTEKETLWYRKRFLFYLKFRNISQMTHLTTNAKKSKIKQSKVADEEIKREKLILVKSIQRSLYSSIILS